MILPDKKVIFIHLPKCGGSSIEVALARHADEIVYEENEHSITLRYGAIQREIEKYFKITFENYKHLTAGQYKEFLGKEYDDYFVFSVMRDPPDRIKSLIHWSGVDPLKFKLSTWKANLHRIINMHAGWLPGDCYLLDEDDNMLVNKVINFNNLAEEFNELITSLGLKHINLPHLNKAISCTGSSDFLDASRKSRSLDGIDTIIENYFSKETKLYNKLFNNE